MKAMLLCSYGEKLTAVDLPVPEPGSGELLVRVKVSGLCGTDVKLVQGKLQVGPLPHILGHEIAGVVAGLGAGVDAGWMGKPVALHLYCACGQCPACVRGEYNMCANFPGRLGFELPGGLAEYVVCPARCAVEIPDGLSFEHACVAPCAMLTALHAANRVRVAAGDRVALIGVGGLGMHGVQLFSAMGAEVTAVDVIEEKLVRAVRLGASRAISFETFQNSAEQYDVLVDMIGNVAAAEDGFARKLARSGRYATVSFLPGSRMSFDCQRLAMDECQIVGVRNGTIGELRDTLAMQAKGDLSPVIDAVLPLEHANEALDRIRGGQLMGRVLVSHSEP